MTPGFFPLPPGSLPTPAQAFRYWCGAPCAWTYADDAWVLRHSRPDLDMAALQQATALRLLAAAHSLQAGLQLLRAPAPAADAALAADALFSDALLPEAGQRAMLAALIALRQALAEHLARPLSSHAVLPASEWSLVLGRAFAALPSSLIDAVQQAHKASPASAVAADADAGAGVDAAASVHYVVPDLAGDAPMLADAADFAARAGRRAASVWQCPPPLPPSAGIPLPSGAGWRVHHHPPLVSGPATPLLLVPALVNGSQLLHLGPGQSLVEALTAEGVSVYQLVWHDAATVLPTLADVLAALRRITAAVRAHAGVRPALFGVCQGGWLTMWAAAADPAQVARLFLAAVPGGRHADDRLAGWLDAAVATGAGVSEPSGSFGPFGQSGSSPSAPLPCPPAPFPSALGAGALNLGFLRLQAFQQRVGKYLQLAAGAAEPDWPAFLRLEHWLFASPALASSALNAFAGQVYGPACPSLDVPGSESSLTSLRLPLHWLLATRDHLVPADATRTLAARLPATTSVEAFEAGHVGLFAGRAQLQVAARVAALLKAE